ncbi:MAG TPA: folate-binding protein, partial [Magnetovibrio sp.]
LIKIDGPDARSYLQGLVSQDMNRVTATQAVYSAFLTPQGKFLYDFFCFEMDGALVLDCEADRRSDFFKRLSMYKLRSNVTLSDITDDFQVYAVLDDTDKLGLGTERGQSKPFGSGVAYVDPRLSTMGARVALTKGDDALAQAGATPGIVEDYEYVRITQGLADGARDMDTDKALLLENGFEELDGVSFSKGCFMGQELTARTRYRGLVKKRLLPVAIDGPVPEAGTVLEIDGREAGEMRTSVGNIGLALVRLDQLTDGASFTAGQTTLTPNIPDWVVFQEKSSE